MTDLHCHILPGIDDGASDDETARKMLFAEMDNGVDQIALTSHFNCEFERAEQFLEARCRALSSLRSIISKQTELSGIAVKAASETMFSPVLPNENLRSLCIENTDYLLIEFPTEYKPYYLRETLYRIQNQGIIPILAHIERYRFFMNDLKELKTIVDNGVCTQINASSLYGGGIIAKLMCKLIECRLVTVVASDAHSIRRRCPDLKKGIDVLKCSLGDDAASLLCANADSIFKGEIIPTPGTSVPRKFFGRYI